jgi:hypothetical protein
LDSEDDKIDAGLFVNLVIQPWLQSCSLC